jgi:hypothetical protein
LEKAMTSIRTDYFLIAPLVPLSFAQLGHAIDRGCSRVLRRCRARETEQQITDDEPFSLVISLMGALFPQSAFPATFPKVSR